MEQNKLIVGGIVILIAVAVIALWVWPGFLQPVEPKSSAANEEVKEETNQNQSPSPLPTAKPTVSPSPTLSYGEAVNAYVGRRIQFDSNCAVTPNYVVFKKGTKIMLDNRSNQTRSVFLDGQKYTLDPYGFRIITITTTHTLPYTMMIDCGTGKNNGQIIIQQ